jgi:hypothetical protein
LPVSNLVAWCIVPFDAKKRGPEERAAMLEQIGIKHFAYDYRAEHIPTFDVEIEACRKHRISIDAWWFPTELNSEGRLILDTLKRHNLKIQLWVTGGGGPVKSDDEQQARVRAEAKPIRPIAEEAAKIGCSVGLYNHGSWFGDTVNQIAIIKELSLPNVGIVYNFHHACNSSTSASAVRFNSWGAKERWMRAASGNLTRLGEGCIRETGAECVFLHFHDCA